MNDNKNRFFLGPSLALGLLIVTLELVGQVDINSRFDRTEARAEQMSSKLDNLSTQVAENSKGLVRIGAKLNDVEAAVRDLQDHMGPTGRSTP